jgi:hypothetical protein
MLLYSTFLLLSINICNGCGEWEMSYLRYWRFSLRFAPASTSLVRQPPHKFTHEHTANGTPTVPLRRKNIRHAVFGAIRG